MLIVRLFTVNGNLYSTSFCISAILECEFRRDSIRRCFCCWRLVRPPGAPAAEEEAALLRGKSQLILLGAPGPRPSKAPACFSQSSSTRPFCSADTSRQGRPEPKGGRAVSSSSQTKRGASDSGRHAGAASSGRTASVRRPGQTVLPPPPGRPGSAPALPHSHSPALRQRRAPPPPACSVSSTRRVISERPRQDVREATAQRGAAELRLPFLPWPGERCLWGTRCRRRRYRHRRRRRRRVLALWRGGGGGAPAQRHKYTNKG